MITAAPQNTTPTCQPNDQPNDKVVNFKHGSCLNAEEKVIPAASEKVVLKHFFSTKTAPEILSARFEKFLSDLWTDKEAHNIDKIIKSSDYLRFFIALKLSASSLNDKTSYRSSINKVPAYEKLEYLLFYILDMLYEAKLMKEGRSDNEVMTKREVQEILKLCKENESELLKIHDLKEILSYSSKDQIELILKCENEFRQLVPSANKTSLKCIEYLKDNIGFAVLLDDIASSSVKRTKLIEMTEGGIGQVIQKNEDFEARFNIYIPEEINGNDKPRKHEKTYNSDVSSFIRQALLHPSGFMRLVIFIVFVFFIMPTAAAVPFRRLQRRSNENNNEQKPDCSNHIASGEELNRLCSPECFQKYDSIDINSLVPMSQAPNCNGKSVTGTNFFNNSQDPDVGFKLAKGVKLREIANLSIRYLTIDGSQSGTQLTEKSTGNDYFRLNVTLGENSHLAQRSSGDQLQSMTIEGRPGTSEFVFDQCEDIGVFFSNRTNAQLCQQTNGSIGLVSSHNSLPEGGSTFGTAMVDRVRVFESSVDGGGLANELTVTGTKTNYIIFSTHNGQLAKKLDVSNATSVQVKMLSTGSSEPTVYIVGNGELNVIDTRLYDANQTCPTDPAVQIKGVEASTKCQTESASSALDRAKTFCENIVVGTEQIKRQCARIEELRQNSTNKNNRCITKGGKAYIEMNHIDCISMEITSTQAETTSTQAETTSTQAETTSTQADTTVITKSSTEKSSKPGISVGAGIGIGIGIVAAAAALRTCVKIRKKAQVDQAISANDNGSLTPT